MNTNKDSPLIHLPFYTPLISVGEVADDYIEYLKAKIP